MAIYSLQQNVMEKRIDFQLVKEFPYFMEPKVQYHAYNCWTPVPIPNQINLVLVPLPHFLKMYFSINFPFKPGLPTGLFPSCFPTNKLYTSLLSAIRAKCPVLLFLLYLITRIIFGYE